MNADGRADSKPIRAGDPPVVFEKHAAVAVISLNRPWQLNAYNMAMRDALHEALEAVRDDPETRVVVLRGNGPAFCTGGDLTEFGTASSPVAARTARWRRDVWGLLYHLEKPTIAAVHGYVVGGGFEMALLCDLCVAARDARFFYPETGLGMIPGVGGTQTMPRLAGWGRALDLVLTGREISAPDAHAWGLVARVVPAAGVRRAAMQLARDIAGMSPAAIRRLKRAVVHGLDLRLAHGLRLEARLARRLW